MITVMIIIIVKCYLADFFRRRARIMYPPPRASRASRVEIITMGTVIERTNEIELTAAVKKKQ